MEKINTSKFYNEEGKLMPYLLGDFLIKEYQLIHIRDNEQISGFEALNTGLYAYNPELGIYQELKGKTGLDRMIFDIIQDINNSKLNETIRYIQATAPVKLRDKRNLIAFKNKLIDIGTMEAVIPSPDIVTTTHMKHVTYAPSITNNELLDGFMFNLFGADEDVHKLAYEIIGYGLYNKNLLGKFFILIGSGGNGKSSFLNLISALYGKHNISNVALEDIAGNRFKLTSIHQKMINIGDDIENMAILATATLKKLITGEAVQLENKGQDPFMYWSRTKLLFSANEIPPIYDQSQGMKDRTVIFPFNKRIRGTSIAKANIVEEIIESGGLTVLLNRAIEGLERLLTNRVFTMPQCVIEATEKYLKENDQVREFLEAVENGEVETPYYNEFSGKLLPLDIGQAPLTETYKAYQSWAKDSGYYPKSRKNFNKAMENLGYSRIQRKINGKPQRVWGILTI